MSPVVHAAILILVGVVASALRPRPSRAWVVAMGGWVAAPLLGELLPSTPSELIFGKEGLLEALTAGLLLAVLVLALRGRIWWLLVPAGLVLLEEIDYGQLFVSFPTPALLAEAEGNTSNRMNFHNLPVLSGLFRLLPLGVLVVLAFKRIVFERVALLGVAVALGLSVPTVWFCGLSRWDESVELALVALVWLCLRQPSVD